MVNLWREVEAGKKPYRTVNAVIEIPKDSKTKYEYNAKKGFLFLDRILHTSMRYPANYGFVPQTLAEDNDPLDIVVLCQESLFPRTILAVRPIGVVRMLDRGKKDSKIIAVSINDPTYSVYKDASDLPKSVVKEVEQFFKVYKELEKKKVVVQGMLSRKQAVTEIEKSVKRFNSNLGAC